MDIELFLHGYCEFFAIGFIKKFGGKLCACWDYNENINRTVLTHAYVKIADDTYVDASGIFKDDRTYIEDNFEELTEFRFVVYDSVDDAKRDFKKYAVPYTDKEIKQAVRDFFANCALLSYCIFRGQQVQCIVEEVNNGNFKIVTDKRYIVAKKELNIVSGEFVDRRR